jgi:predicted esterase
MQQHTLKVPKTARYFQLGEFTPSTKQVWIVLHGYGQLASYFIKWFEPILDDETVIIAPEGLHRFYWQGFSGKVVASWMTKEDRENDIVDYINFLDEVMDCVKVNMVNPTTKIIAFGFSQGVASVSRWVFNTKKHHPDELVLWAGLFPSDFALENSGMYHPKKPIYVLFGDEDEFYQEYDQDQLRQTLLNYPFDFLFINYKGGHKVMETALMDLKSRLNGAQ